MAYSTPPHNPQSDEQPPTTDEPDPSSSSMEPGQLLGLKQKPRADIDGSPPVQRHRLEEISDDTCHGKVIAYVRRVGLIMRPLLRGGIEEGVDIDKGLNDLPRFWPLFVSR